MERVCSVRFIDRFVYILTGVQHVRYIIYKHVYIQIYRFISYNLLSSTDLEKAAYNNGVTCKQLFGNL